MKVVTQDSLVAFSSLKSGQVFKASGGVFYMKTTIHGDEMRDSVNSVSLENGQLNSFGKDVKVVPYLDAFVTAK